MHVAALRVFVHKLFEVVEVKLRLNWGNVLFKSLNRFAANQNTELLVDEHKFGVYFDVVGELFASPEPIVILYRLVQPMSNHLVTLTQSNFVKVFLVLTTDRSGEVDGLSFSRMGGLRESLDLLPLRVQVPEHIFPSEPPTH